jgi:hypothetical protein
VTCFSLDPIFIGVVHCRAHEVWSPTRVDLPFHCKIIQTCCNAIQTLLRSNSNNSNQCAVLIYFAVAAIRGEWRRIATFGGGWRVLLRRVRRESDALCTELIFSECEFHFCNCLILHKPQKAFHTFSRTSGSDPVQNPVTYSTQVAYVMNRSISLE